jgi:glycerol-3-phosphate acyltransferase PlsY
VATAGGVLIAFDWRIGLAVIVVWLVVVAVTRYSSVGALTAAVAAPIAAWLFAGPGPIFLCVTAMAVLLIVRHHTNIRKLARGQESRIGAKKDNPAKEAVS